MTSTPTQRDYSSEGEGQSDNDLAPPGFSGRKPSEGNGHASTDDDMPMPRWVFHTTGCSLHLIALVLTVRPCPCGQAIPHNMLRSQYSVAQCCVHGPCPAQLGAYLSPAPASHCTSSAGRLRGFCLPASKADSASPTASCLAQSRGRQAMPLRASDPPCHPSRALCRLYAPCRSTGTDTALV